MKKIIHYLQNIFKRKEILISENVILIRTVFEKIYSVLPDKTYTMFAYFNGLPESNKSGLVIEYTNGDTIGRYDGFVVELKDDMINISIPPKISDDISCKISNKLSRYYNFRKFDNTSFWTYLSFEK